MRIRHEYRYSFGEGPKPFSGELSSNSKVRNPTESDIPELAELMLDSYQGTMDYDGETIQEAKSEVESYFGRTDSTAILPCSFVALLEGHIVSACLVSKWEKRSEPLISYIMTKRKFKSHGMAKALVRRSLQSIRDAGFDGACGFVTEGNTPSERLLIDSGFRRVQ